MPFVSVTDAEEAQDSFERLAIDFQHGATPFHSHFVGHQGGGGRYDVYWHGSQKTWGLFQRREDLGRFWNCFGINDPSEKSSLTITVEMNPPLAGVNRHCAGAFLRDADGRIYIAHNGRVGGGRKGIGQQAFRQFAQGVDWQQVTWPDGRISSIIVVTPLDAPDIAINLAKFVHEVARFKDWAVSGEAQVSVKPCLSG